MLAKDLRGRIKRRDAANDYRTPFEKLRSLGSRLDHINLLSSDVKTCRTFYQEFLGLRLTEQIIFNDGSEKGAWLSATISLTIWL